MIIDTSALVAILRLKPERQRFISMIVDSSRPRISAATYVEAFLVLYPLDLSEELDLLIHDVGIEIVDLTSEQALLATTAANGSARAIIPPG